jgi:parallel beta-helix repeat protein
MVTLQDSRRAAFRLMGMTLALVVLGAAPAMAKEYRVDDDHAQCPTAQFTSIQAAVDASGRNDTVKVCPGNYTEQVRINGPQHDGLKLESLQQLEAFIRFPAVTLDSNILVRVTGARKVTIRGFTITGPYTYPSCDTAPLGAHEGVRVDGGGDANIRENHITEIRNGLPSLLGCQDGLAVRVGRAADATSGTAVIEKNTIDTYQKNGPTIDGPGSSAEIKNNTIDGGGPNLDSALNGIQIGRGATADVHDNAVFGNSYIGAGLATNPDEDTSNDASGILLFELPDGGVRVHDNAVYQNDLGIPFDTASGLTIFSNDVTQNKYDGIRAFDTATENTIRENRLSQNGVHDCHDDSHGNGTLGTANFWKNNRGMSPGGDVPPGLCRKNG